MRPNGRVLFSGAVVLLALGALAETVGWPIKTALYPRAIGVPLLVLAGAETLLSVRRKDDAEAGGAMDFALSDETAPDVALRRTIGIVAWMGGFFAVVILIGFPRAIPLFVFAYLKGQGKEGWIISVLLPAFAWLGFDLLFVRLLHIPFADGLLWR